MNTLQNRVIQRTSKTLTEKRALLQLLTNDYRFDNFITMRQGFDANEIEDRETARHYIIESRVFNSGFNMKAMKPEVHRRIRKLDPNHKYKTFKKRLLADYKEKNVEINRTISKSAFYRMLHDRHHWRDYNNPATHNTLTDNHLPDITSTGMQNSQVEEKRDKDVVHDEEDTLEAKKYDGNVAETKEKSVVLERRLGRPRNDGFSMTMKTLGPVYFQATVSTEPNVTN